MQDRTRYLDHLSSEIGSNLTRHPVKWNVADLYLVEAWLATRLVNTGHLLYTHLHGQKLVLYPKSVSSLSQAWRTPYREGFSLTAAIFLEARPDQTYRANLQPHRGVAQASIPGMVKPEKSTEKLALRATAADQYIAGDPPGHHHHRVLWITTVFQVYTAFRLAAYPLDRLHALVRVVLLRLERLLQPCRRRQTTNACLEVLQHMLYP